MFQYSGKKRFLFFAFIEEILDRFQFFGWDEVGIRQKLIHQEPFELSLSFDYSFLFFSPGLNFFLQHPGREIQRFGCFLGSFSGTKRNATVASAGSVQLSCVATAAVPDPP